MLKFRSNLAAAVAATLLIAAGCSKSSSPKKGESGPANGATAEAPGASKDTPTFAYITNGVADFWEHAEAGAKKAGEDLGVDVTVIMPSSITDQTRKIEDLLTRGTNGIAISPINPENQVEAINKAAAQTNLITHDADAPQTNRLVYVGMDNFNAGLLCGATLRKALPNGGKVMILVGRLEQDNAKRRRQGFIDSFLGRQPNPEGIDPSGEELKSDDGKYIILGTMTDQFDRAKAKANAEDAFTRHPDIAAMVGLFEYNPPAIIEALERTGSLGKVKVMGFDESPVLLQAVKDGTAVGTVVQNPYQYGYKSIEVLNELHKGNKSVVPDNKFIDIPARVIDSSNVDAFRQELEERLGKK